MGRALLENGEGILKTFDNLNHSEKLKELELSQEKVISENIKQLNLSNTILFYKCSILSINICMLLSKYGKNILKISCISTIP